MLNMMSINMERKMSSMRQLVIQYKKSTASLPMNNAVL